jgi:predicted nucleic acid-binding protein
MKPLYLDASAIIYMVETPSPFTAATQECVQQHTSQPGGRLLTSRLSRLECRVPHVREKNATRLAEYDDFFTAEEIDVADVSAGVIERATDLRARYGLKTPDALHLATAIEYGAGTVLTGEPAWKRCKEVDVVVVTAKAPE